MNYLPPFARLQACLTKNEATGTVEMPLEVFKMLLKAAAGEALDETWYATANPDVGAAIEQNLVPDSLTHFSSDGYFEGRRPRLYPVNEDWYCTRYPDVGASLLSGRTGSAHYHFNHLGYFEGRVPSPDMVETVEAWNRLIEKYGQG